jgi:hypothetical protein
VVSFETGLDERLTDFRILSSGGVGISSVPLLSVNDRITLHKAGNLPVWFDDPLPVEITENEATWRGPLEGGGHGQVVAFGYGAPEGMEGRQGRADTIEQEEGRRKAETLQDFLSRFEQRVGGGIIKQTWRTLILLIPFIGLLWLARRCPFGTAETWRPLAAATLILAIWRSWYYLYTLSINGPAIWLNRLTSPILFTLQIETGGFLGSEYQSLGDVGANSFVLIFVLFVGLAPLYFSGLIGTGFDWRPEPATVGRRSVIRRIAASSWLGARLVYGALLLASVLFVARLTSVAREEFTEVPEWMAAIGELLPSWMNDSQLLAMLLIGLLCLFLFLFGIRAALFGLGLFAVATRLVMTTDFLSIRSLDSFPGLNLINQVPWLVVVLFVGLTACPLLLRLLSVLFPFARDRSGFRWLLTAGLILVSLLLSRLPSQVLLRAGGPLIAIGIGWVAVHGLANSRLMAPVMNRVRGSPWVVILVLGTIGLLIGWPLGELVETLRLRDLFYLMAELDDLFVYIVGFGLICLIWDHSLQHPDVIFEQSVLTAGLYLFAFLLINSSTTWLFIPVPFLVALLIARFWLFRPAAEMDGLREAVGKGFRNLKRLIQEALDASDARSRFRAARKALASQFEKATLTPAEYEEKLEAYEGYLQKKLKGEVTQVGITSRTAVFAIGEPSVRGNMMAALKVGSVLAFIPFCIALYRYFPTGRVDYPYPMADLLVFFVWAAASWLLYAIFFGYFLVHLRGNNGLAKGIRLFVALSIPFAIYRVLETQSLAHMRPFILWAAQLFLFCSLLGLLAVDYRLLRKSGFKFRDLRVVHNLPTLSAYASTVMAALIPGIVALFTGRLTDFVRFFLDTIIKVPSGGP